MVACELGRMYNKEEVLARLLDRSNEPAIAHIKGLKDVKELGLTPNPGHQPEGPLTGELIRFFISFIIVKATQGQK